MIDESGSEVIEEVIGSIDFPKQERSGIRSNGSPAEIGYQFSRSKALKMKLFGITLCIRTGPFSLHVI
jgi:hypothetical protein